MTIRSIAGLLLGLVLQVYLVVPAGACVARERCEMRSSSCTCSESGKSCPCAKSTDGRAETPVPATPPSPAVKVHVIAPSWFTAIAPEAGRGMAHETLHRLPPFATEGYRGVGLCVSYCRLVI